MTFDDNYIEHWGEIYRASTVLQRYCTFERFLARPREIAGDVGRALLARQLEVQRRLDAARRQA